MLYREKECKFKSQKYKKKIISNLFFHYFMKYVGLDPLT